MEKEIKIHNEYTAKFTVDNTKLNLVFDRIIKYCVDNNCVDGETLMQDDNCIISAPEVLSDIIDDIIKFDCDWGDE